MEMNENTKKLIEFANRFGVKGDFDSIEVIDNGHINTTFKLIFNEGGNKKEYILQKINKYVFKQPEVVMSNIIQVTNHIKQKTSNESRTLNFSFADDGNPYVIDEYGDYWRVCEFVKNSQTFNEPNDLSIIEQTGEAFGDFQGLLSDFVINENFQETIPNFHNTLSRYNNFRETLAKNPVNRAELVQDEINQYSELEQIATQMYHMQASGELPLRVTHNDTKCNNVLFDKKTGKFLCVIDLDTVMPGLLGFDFGDAIRSISNTAAEDEADLSKVDFDMEKFKAFAKGFLSTVGDRITEKERKTLALGAITMTAECGVRFLTDYLDGDNYFKTAYPEHNLVRARNQLKLAQLMIERKEEMDKAVESIYSVLSTSTQKL